MARSASRKLLDQLPTEDEKAAIIASLRLMASDEDKRMFDGARNGILGTFSNKIRVAYALGLLPPEAYADLLIINDIRNAFAHSLHRNVDFNNDHIKDDCAKLEYLRKYSMDPVPDNPILLFVETVRKVYLGFREDADNQIAFVTAYEKTIAEADATYRGARPSARAPSRHKPLRPSRRNQPR
jgi:hypothetical protein